MQGKSQTEKKILHKSTDELTHVRENSFEKKQSSKLHELPDHKLAELDYKIYKREIKA